MSETSKPVAPLREIAFPEDDLPLRDDVRRLGALVGEILKDQAGIEFFAEVERIRKAAISRREKGDSLQILVAEISAVDPDHKDDLIRAFSTYFHVVNIAERVHRIRRRRAHQKSGEMAQPGGLNAVLKDLANDGITLEALKEFLPTLQIEPVFTAHPTEAVRSALLIKEHVIVKALAEDFDHAQTPPERRASLAIIRTALTAGWQTAEVRTHKPSVADESEHVGFYLTQVLYRVLPVFYESLQHAVRENFGSTTELPTLLRFGTWVGGDMDGNPNAGASTIVSTLRMQRAEVLAAYQKDLYRLADTLSQSSSRIGISRAVSDRITQYQQLLPDLIEPEKTSEIEMPYLRLLDYVRERLRRTAKDEPGAYSELAEFSDDLKLIEHSLIDNRGEHAGLFSLQRIMWRVRTFGFHLACLDLRQDSATHDDALASLLALPEFPDCSDDQRRAVLDGDLAAARAAVATADESARRVIDVFQTIARLLPVYGDSVFGPYIISMARGPADVLAVLALARIGGLEDTSGQVPLDIAPLLETVADLEQGENILRSLFDDPKYRAHLHSRGNRQWVMLGYSDSAKDGGLIASRWSLQQAQVRLTALARESGIAISFFHGRGGTLSRGGSKTERAVIAAPVGSVCGVLRVTEQGEVIHRKYGIRALALRNLEQATGAVMRASLRPRSIDQRVDTWRQIMTLMSQASRSHYRAMVYENPDFPEYFRLATPIDVIERMKIGSRPSRRIGSGGVERLRAIPWVFSWAQNRCGFTAWYGVGTGLNRCIEEFGLEALQSMAGDWPFFETMLDDLEMVLAKCDMSIFASYSQLAGPLHETMFGQIEQEYQRSIDTVLRIRNRDALLTGDQRLSRSIRLRNPYVDPISVLQVELLKQWRTQGSPDGAVLQTLFATVNGISAGVQNTG